jgi:GNAT superfamily N-acetyltransferase
LFRIDKIKFEDIPNFRETAIQCFTENYKAGNEDQYFNAYLRDNFSLTQLEKEYHTLDIKSFLIKEGDCIIGIIKLSFNKSQYTYFGPEWMELSRIYLLKEYHGKGYGKRAFEFSIQKAKSLRKSKLWLGVWPKNETAITFYTHMGMSVYGTHAFNFGGLIEEDLVFTLDL